MAGRGTASKGNSVVLGSAVAAAAAVAVAARREKVSVRGWLAAHLLIPALYGRRNKGIDAFRVRIAESRAAGPALPSAKIRTKYHFADEDWDGARVFRTASKNGKASRLRILYIHGGAYVFDLMPLQWPIIIGLVDRTGAEVVSAIYPLAPEHNVEQGLAAVETVYLRLVAEVGAGNVVVCGDSAGGGLALALTQRLRDSGHAMPAAQVLFFPWLDATCSGDDQPALSKIDPLLSIEELREAGRMWAGATPITASASPLFGIQSGLPPALVLVGTRDLLISDARRFAALSADVELHEYSSMFHGWICAPIPEARMALDQAVSFISRYADSNTMHSASHPHQMLS